MKKLLLTTSVMISLFSNKLFAVQSYLVYSPQEVAVFEVRFFDTGDGPFMSDWPKPSASTWDLNQQQKEKILHAMRYWAEIITPLPGELPAIVNVGTFNDVNAAGSSDSVTDGMTSITQLQGAMTGIDTGDLSFGSHAQFIMGKMDFDDVPYVPSQLPRTGHTDLVNVAIHELAHGLGITSMASDYNGAFTPAFDFFPLGTWTASLRDDNGNAAYPGQVIVCQGCNNQRVPWGFDVRKDQGYFTGEHVSEVLAGDMPGIPVKMLNDYGYVDTDYMSHIELKNSMMSHQNYRNYMTFMEAELALLQDMGYQIDRRNFFGFSLYGNGKVLINQHGYFLRESTNGGYQQGKYNTATLGLGLHVYGSNNTIYQQADLLTSGVGGAGIRIDGQNNTLTIEPETQVHADGINGRGVLFAYGKDHNLIQRGDVQSLGMNGIAISFDFGDNSLGNNAEYRGSWIHNVEGYAAPLLPELTGALVDNVDISGRVAGKGAAIYQSPNALVNHINILNGAKIYGDIYSDYSQQDIYGLQRLTDLSFGQRADTEGRATGEPDPLFRFSYKGKIEGIDNFALNMLGGTTSLTGTHKIYSLYVAPGATLTGNSHYTLNQAGMFINRGTFIPGEAMGKANIVGNYQQGADGELRLGINGSGGHDTLEVKGHAEFNGRLSFVPQRDWYSPGWRLNSNEFLKTTSYSGQFSEITGLFLSPTLKLTAVPATNNDWTLRMSRAQDAYSQYGRDRNEKSTGTALDSIVGQAQPAIQKLYRALDFSAADGSDIVSALQQLSPAAWGSMFASSLHREQQIADIISDLSSNNGQIKQGDEWISFAIPFVGNFERQHQAYRSGYSSNSYGMIVGAERQNGDNSRAFGFHGAVSGQSVTMKSPDSGTGKTTAFNIGLQARYGFTQQEGGYLSGNARVGVEDGWLERRVRVGDYTANHRASWTGLAGSASLGGGYNFSLSDNNNVGPVAGLNYTMLHRPGVTENGDGSGLKLGSATFNSLRSSVGLKYSANYSLYSGTKISTALKLTWDHELLDTSLRQTANFAGYNRSRFTHRNQIVGRNALGIKTGMRYQINRNVELGAGVSSELFGSGYDSLSGDLSVSWHF